MKKFFSFAAIVAAMFTLLACGESSGDAGAVCPAEPAISNDLKNYIQVVKVSPVALVNDIGRFSSSMKSYFDYAKGSITIKCINSYPEDENQISWSVLGNVILLDGNGTPLYDGNGDITRKNSKNEIRVSDIKGMAKGEEKTINYTICIKEDKSGTGPVTDKEVIKEILGPVKYVQITDLN